MRKHYRQGDLLFVEIDNVPAIVEEVKDGVLAEGEATGHRHYIAPEDLLKCRVGWAGPQSGDGPRRIVIDTIEKIRVRHPNHNKQEIVINHPVMVLRQEENIAGILRQVRD